MVTPRDYLSFAAQHQRSTSEIHRRASVSHSYYAAFHHLREIAEERVGLPHFGTADDHRELLGAVRQLDVAIADEFQYLRRLRVIADYELDFTVLVNDAVECHESALRVFEFS